MLSTSHHIRFSSNQGHHLHFNVSGVLDWRRKLNLHVWDSKLLLPKMPLIQSIACDMDERWRCFKLRMMQSMGHDSAVCGMVERKKYIEFHFCTIRHFIIDDEKNLDRKRSNLGDELIALTCYKVMRLVEARQIYLDERVRWALFSETVLFPKSPESSGQYIEISIFNIRQWQSPLSKIV